MWPHAREVAAEGLHRPDQRKTLRRVGSRFEVWAYRANPDPSRPGPGYGQDYYFDLVPCRQSLLGAVWAAWRARRTVPYVRIEWR